MSIRLLDIAHNYSLYNITKEQYQELLNYYYYVEDENVSDTNCKDVDIISEAMKGLPGYARFFNVFLPILCLTGIIGILLTVIVLSRKNMATSTNTYLIALAIADLGFLLVMATRWVGLAKMDIVQMYRYKVYHTFSEIPLHIFLLASVWLTVMLAVERYIAICHPLRAISICTVKRARLIITGIFLFAFICRISNFFEIEIKHMKTNCGKNVIYVMPSDLGQNLNYRVSYTWIVDCILCCILPFLALFYFNLRLILEIHKSTQYLRFHIGADPNMQTMVSSEQMKITMMLIGIIIVFFICQAPMIVATAFRQLHQYQFPEQMDMDVIEIYNLVNFIVLSLLCFKSSFNFIVYCWFSEKFWNTFKRVFCLKNCVNKRKQYRKSHTHTVHSADQNGTTSVRKASCLTKDTIC